MIQMVPQVSTILGSVPMVLMIMAIEALITPHRISCHLVWPFEEWLAFNLLQNLLYWFSEHSIHRLGVSRSWLPNKIFPRSVVMGLVRLEIPHLLTKMTDMFHWIYSTIVNDEHGLMKSPRKTRVFYISRER